MILNFQPAQSPESPVLLALHGWTGDENTMTIFTNRIGARYSRLLPRAPYPADGSGFSWVPPETIRPSRFEDLLPAANQIAGQWREWIAERGANPPNKLALIGFSQGAALALTLAISHPEIIDRAAILAGFLPVGAPEMLPEQVSLIRFFISHGTEDSIVPFDRAELTVARLQQTGANVHFCSAPVGHRISAGCFKELEEFFAAD